MLHLLRHLVPFLMMGSIIDSIGNFLAGIPGDIKGAVTKVWQALKAAWHVTRGVFLHVGDAWQGLYHHLHDALSMAGDAIHAAYSTIHHLALNVLPHAIGWVASQAWHYAKAAAGAVEHWAAARFRTVIGWARKAINLVKHEAEHLYRILAHDLAAAVRWIEHVGKRAVDLVLHPSRLVSWILPHLVWPLIKELLKLSRPLVRYFMRVALSLAGEIANDLESVIADLFL